MLNKVNDLTDMLDIYTINKLNHAFNFSLFQQQNEVYNLRQ